MNHFQQNLLFYSTSEPVHPQARAHLAHLFKSGRGERHVAALDACLRWQSSQPGLPLSIFAMAWTGLPLLNYLFDYHLKPCGLLRFYHVSSETTSHSHCHAFGKKGRKKIGVRIYHKPELRLTDFAYLAAAHSVFLTSTTHKSS